MLVSFADALQWMLCDGCELWNGNWWNWYESIYKWLDVCISVDNFDAGVGVSMWMMINDGMLWSSDDAPNQILLSID